MKLKHYIHVKEVRVALLVVTTLTLIISLITLGWQLHPETVNISPDAYTPASMIRPTVVTRIVTKTLPPKVIVKTVPGPERTVVKYVSRSSTRVPLRAAPVETEYVAPSGVAACIRKYESGGDYTAQNPTSTASGAYQFLDSTWQAVTGLSGRAMNYSPATQDAAFYKLWDNGAGRTQWVTHNNC